MGPTHTLVNLTGGVMVASFATHTYQDAGVLVGAMVAVAKLPDVDVKLPGVPHRGPATHSLLAAGLFAVSATIAAGFLITPELALLVGAGLALGVVLHVLADALTISGVPLLWPVVRRDVHLLPAGWRVRTSGPVEAVLAFLLLAGLLAFLWMTYGR